MYFLPIPNNLVATRILRFETAWRRAPLEPERLGRLKSHSDVTEPFVFKILTLFAELHIGGEFMTGEAVLLAKLQNAFVFAWPEDSNLEGLVVFRGNDLPIRFHAEDEESAINEGMRLAGHPRRQPHS